MGTIWDKPPKFEATLKKRGLEPYEFESILLSKIRKMFDHQKVIVSEDVSKTVKELRKEVCFRENKTTPTLDQRNVVASKGYVESGILEDWIDTPIQRQKKGSEKGTFVKNRVELYHEWQRMLFGRGGLLEGKLRNLVPWVAVNSEGYFVDSRDADQLTPEEASDCIDKFTCELILSQVNDQVPPGEWAPQDIPSIRKRCVLILMGRRLVDWATENNLMNYKDYMKWKHHILMEMSYAALVVVLDLIIKKRQLEKVRSKETKKSWQHLVMSVMYTVIPKFIGITVPLLLFIMVVIESF